MSFIKLRIDCTSQVNSGAFNILNCSPPIPFELVKIGERFQVH